MKRLFLAFLLLGCTPQRYAYRLTVPGSDNGKIAGISKFQAEIREESGRRVNPQKVQWASSGPVVSEGEGRFRVTGPGKVTLRATLPIAGENKTLEGLLSVAGVEEVRPTPLPTMTPAAQVAENPILTPSPTPTPRAVPTPEPTPEPDDAEAMILAAYGCADRGDYQAALKCLEPIRDPGWLPKVRTLKAQWSKPVVDALIQKAAKALLDGDYSTTLNVLGQLKGLPKTAKQQEQELRVRTRLKELL